MSRYFITLTKDDEGIFIENCSNKYKIDKDMDIYVNSKKFARIFYTNTKNESSYLTSITDGLEYIKVEKID